MTDIRFTVPIEPKGKGRPRASAFTVENCERCAARGKKRCMGHAKVYTPQDTADWEHDFASVAALHRPDAIIETPCRVDVLAVKRRPQSKLRQKDPDGLMWAPTKPDGDNIRKAVIDALKSWWRDDALVCVGQTVTVYAERTGLPRVVVRVRTLNNVNPDDIVIPVFTRDAMGGSTAPRQMPLTGGRS